MIDNHFLGVFEGMKILKRYKPFLCRAGEEGIEVHLRDGTSVKYKDVCKLLDLGWIGHGNFWHY